MFRYIFVKMIKLLEIPSTLCPPLAQLVEQRTFNPLVVGSNPTGRTQGIEHPK